MTATNMPTEADIAAISQKIDAAVAELKRLQAEKKAMLLAPWGIKPGVAVRLTQRREGGRALVTEVEEPWGKGRPWVQGRVQKKDGTWGAVSIGLFDHWRLESEDA